MSFRIALLGLAVSAFTGTAAFGQETPRSIQANHLGVLEYCQAQGFSSAEAIQAQRNTINHTNPGGPVEAAEATGRQGILIGSASQRPVEAIAATMHSTVARWCQQFSQVAIRNANR